MKTKWKEALIILAAAGAFTALAGLKLFDSAEGILADKLYQTPGSAPWEVAVIGIDDRALDTYGPFSGWSRDIIADVIDTLNVDETCRPAAIGVDVIFSGERSDAPEADRHLVEAAGRYGNVVMAGVGEMGDDLVLTDPEDPDSYALKRMHVREFSEPFQALRDVVTVGHINVMLDDDGILRHNILRLSPDEGEKIDSFALQLAEMYTEYSAEWTGTDTVKEPPVDAYDSWYVPFTGLPGDFSDSVSVADILSGDVDPYEFADRIVLIGPYAAGLQDSYVTSIDHSQQMFGLEYQANVISALLSGRYQKEVKRLPQLIALFLITAASAFFLKKRSVKLSAAYWAGLCAAYVGLCKLLFTRGIILRVLWIPLGVTVCFIVSIAVNYIREAVERYRVTNTFKHYVDPSIIKELMDPDNKAALDLCGRQVRIAVLFVDIRGFTTMSESLTPQEVVSILNDYLTLIADCIMKNGGTLDKYVGDCAMAFWGAPLPCDDYVMKAVKAAEDMKKGAAPLSEELFRKYGRTVSFGIGVNVGEAVVGNIGSPQRMDYTAIGDTVNTASRLESNAPKETIYISRAVADELGDRIRTTSLGDSIKLKGKAEGFEVLIMEEILKP